MLDNAAISKSFLVIPYFSLKFTHHIPIALPGYVHTHALIITIFADYRLKNKSGYFPFENLDPAGEELVPLLADRLAEHNA